MQKTKDTKEREVSFWTHSCPNPILRPAGLAKNPGPEACFINKGTFAPSSSPPLKLKNHKDKDCTQQLDRTGQRECGCLLADGSPRLRGREKEFKSASFQRRRTGNGGISIGEEVFHCFILKKSSFHIPPRYDKRIHFNLIQHDKAFLPRWHL